MSRVFSLEELSQFDGTKSGPTIYVAIKRTVFDVSTKPDMYGPGKGYNIFAGKDASKALGKNSLKVEDCVGDISSLNDEETKALDNWFTFFEKRYPIVGTTQ